MSWETGKQWEQSLYFFGSVKCSLIPISSVWFETHVHWFLLKLPFFLFFFFLPILHVQTLLGNSLAQVTQQSCFFSDGLSPSIQFYKSTSLIISEYLLELTTAKQSSSVSSRNCFTMQFWYSPTQFWPLSLIYLPSHKSCRILFF